MCSGYAIYMHGVFEQEDIAEGGSYNARHSQGKIGVGLYGATFLSK